ELLRLAEEGRSGAGEIEGGVARGPARLWRATRAIGPTAPPADWRELGVGALVPSDAWTGLLLLTGAATGLATVPAGVLALRPRTWPGSQSRAPQARAAAPSPPTRSPSRLRARSGSPSCRASGGGGDC